MGVEHCKKRTFSDIHRVSSTVKPASTILSACRQNQGSGVEERGRGHAGQACHRSGVEPILAGILQSDLPGTQKEWPMATSNRPQFVEPVPTGRQVQNDYTAVHKSSPVSTGLCCQSGLARCVLPCSHTPWVVEVPEVRHGGQNVLFSCSPVRHSYGSSGVHTCLQCHRCFPPPTQHQHRHVFRRLADLSQGSSISSCRCEGVTALPIDTGYTAQSGEERPDPSSEVYLHRGGVLDGSVPGLAASGSCSQTPKSLKQTVQQQSVRGQRLSQPDRHVQFYDGVHPLRENALETSTMVPQRSILSKRRSGNQDNSARLVYPQGYDPMLEESSLAPSGGTNAPPNRSTDIGNRCLTPRLGRLSREVRGFRSVEQGRPILTHKRPGAESSPSVSSPVRSTSKEQGSVGVVGQCNSSPIHQQTGRHPLKTVQQHDCRNSDVVSEKGHKSSSKTHSRGTQCSSGRIVQERGRPQGVDPSLQGDRRDFQSVGDAPSRPVCKQAELQTSQLCLSVSRSGRVEHRRSVHAVDRVGGIRLSTRDSADKDTRENGGGTMRADSNRSPVASQELVPPAPELSHGTTSTTSSVENPVATTPIGGICRQRLPGEVQPTCLEVVLPALRSQGFSPRSARAIASSNRASSIRLYDSRWKIYSRWCEQRNQDPFQASVPLICSFLSYIKEERKLSVAALKGYRSAISSVIRSATSGGRDLSTDPSLRAYIRHHVIANPRPYAHRPPWDLGVVLHSLCKPPYEPMKDASQKQVTLKAVFLLSLALGRRRSYIHALLYGHPYTLFTNDGSSMSLRPCPAFVAKNEKTRLS